MKVTDLLEHIPEGYGGLATVGPPDMEPDDHLERLFALGLPILPTDGTMGSVLRALSLPGKMPGLMKSMADDGMPFTLLYLSRVGKGAKLMTWKLLVLHGGKEN